MISQSFRGQSTRRPVLSNHNSTNYCSSYYGHVSEPWGLMFDAVSWHLVLISMVVAYARHGYYHTQASRRILG